MLSVPNNVLENSEAVHFAVCLCQIIPQTVNSDIITRPMEHTHSGVVVVWLFYYQ